MALFVEFIVVGNVGMSWIKFCCWDIFGMNLQFGNFLGIDVC